MDWFIGCFNHDGISAYLMLLFQDPVKDLSLRDGIMLYRQYLLENNRKLLIDQPGSTLIRDHDATHVIFGLDTTLEEEALLDSWVIWGCQYKFRYLNQYRKHPQLQGFSKQLFRELGFRGFLKLFLNVINKKFNVFRRTRKMKKKWPFKHPEYYLDRSVLELRKSYGIDILSKEDRTFINKIKWSGSF